MKNIYASCMCVQLLCDDLHQIIGSIVFVIRNNSLGPNPIGPSEMDLMNNLKSLNSKINFIPGNDHYTLAVHLRCSRKKTSLRFSE